MYRCIFAESESINLQISSINQHTVKINVLDPTRDCSYSYNRDALMNANVLFYSFPLCRLFIDTHRNRVKVQFHQVNICCTMACSAVAYTLRSFHSLLCQPRMRNNDSHPCKYAPHLAFPKTNEKLILIVHSKVYLCQAI